MSTVILGAGGHAKVVLDILKAVQKEQGVQEEIEFLDDNIPRETRIEGIRVAGKIEDCRKYSSDTKFIIGIGNNNIRREIAERYKILYTCAIHPRAVLGSSVEIEEGTVVAANAVINYGGKIGRHCIINTGATVDHECRVEEFVHVSPGAHLGGNVELGKRCWLGIGSIVKNNIRIASESIIGAGAVVVKNIEKPGTYVGVPALRVGR